MVQLDSGMIARLHGSPGAFPVAFSGSLLKRSGTKGSTFQNRFFVLHGSILSYFKEASDSIPVGSLMLDDSASIQIPSESVRLREFEFHLCLKPKTYHLVASSLTHLNQWVERIAKAMFFSKVLSEIPPPIQKSPTWNLLSKALHRGLLKKQGGSHKSWHERYFILVSGSAPALYYFKSVPEGHCINCLGSIPLKRSYLLPDVREALPSPTLFAIMTPTRQYFLDATSQDDRDLWFSAFDKALNNV